MIEAKQTAEAWLVGLLTGFCVGVLVAAVIFMLVVVPK
jgi:hypothetical protein